MDLSTEGLPTRENLTAEETQNMLGDIMRLSIAAEGINGPNTFDLERAAYGYIHVQEKVVYPAALRDKIRRQTEASHAANFAETDFNRFPLNFIDVMSIAYWNWNTLKKRDINADTAFFLAMYRARLTFLGYMYVDKADRAVTIDEVVFSERAMDFHQDSYAGGTHANARYTQAYDAALNNVDVIGAYLIFGVNNAFRQFLVDASTGVRADMVAHILQSAQQYAAMTYLVFRQMGHHYTQEYNDKYNIMWRATTLEKPQFTPNNELIHRVAIHSFGLKALHEKFYYNLEARKLAETFVDRADVAPAGTAMVATCYAAIKAMRSLPIWNSFYDAFKPNIDALEQQTFALKGANARDAIRFHKNARLFGVAKVTIDTSHADALAPHAKGFIDCMGPTADLGRQRTLDKRAAQNPIISALVTDIINVVTEKIATSGDLSVVLAKNRPLTSQTTTQAAQIEAVPEVVEGRGGT